MMSSYTQVVKCDGCSLRYLRGGKRVGLSYEGDLLEIVAPTAAQATRLFAALQACIR